MGNEIEKLTEEVKKKMVNVVIKYGDREYAFNMYDELSIAVEDAEINDQLASQPGRYAYWSAMYHAAKEEAAIREAELKVAIANLDGELRENWDKLFPEVRRTEDAIAKKIEIDPQIIKKVGEVIEAKKKMGYMETMKEAFAQRKDALISLATNIRSQRDNSEMKFKNYKMEE